MAKRKRKAGGGRKTAGRGYWPGRKTLIFLLVFFPVLFLLREVLFPSFFSKAFLDDCRRELNQVLGASMQYEVNGLTRQAKIFLDDGSLQVDQLARIRERYRFFRKDGTLTSKEAREVLGLLQHLLEGVERTR
jgi:hypothetical protein